MKKYFLAALLALFLTGCISTPEDELNKMKKPVVVIAKSFDGDILVRDSIGTLLIIDRDCRLAGILNSLKIGDTIR
jgi:hypothetical protein